MEDKWFENCYLRTELELHFGNSESFLSKFKPQEYANLLKKANVDAAAMHAQNIAGYAFWPTKLGNAHPSLKGRDILGEALDACHQEGIKMILYFSVIHSHWTYLNYPKWRVINVEGNPALAFNDRVGSCCPNSPYRNFVVAQLEELTSNYEFEGIWFDMNQWPDFCYCNYCRNRYLSEAGIDIPESIDWSSAPWVKFERKREKWLYEFYELVNATVKRINPKISVAHQNASFGIHQRKMMANSADLAKYSDYMMHDFFGGPMEQSFFSKFFSTLGKSSRFDYMTPGYYFNAQPGIAVEVPNVEADSYEYKDKQEGKKNKALMNWSVGLWPATKTEALLEAQASYSIAHNGSVIFFDDVDCDGTFHSSFYEKLGRVFGKLAPYKKYLGGKPCQDVGIYINLESAIDPGDNGKPALTRVFHENYFSRWEISPEPAISAAKSLLYANIPFGVITKNRLDRLKDFQLVILSNQIMIDEEEAKAFREFVKDGGSIYASKNTSLLDKMNGTRDNFLLSDLFGVSYVTEQSESVTFCSPSKAGEKLFPGFSYAYPFPIPGSQIRVSLNPQTEVLATLTLPYTDTLDPSDNYCHMHTDHPSRHTDYPSVVLKKFGKGNVIYSTGIIEGVQFDPCRDVFVQIVRSLLLKKPRWESDAPKPVEVIVFEQKDNKRYLVSVVNFQSDLPNIPINNINIRLNVSGRKAKRVAVLPDENKIDFSQKNDIVYFNLPKLETLLMLLVDYLE